MGNEFSGLKALAKICYFNKIVDSWMYKSKGTSLEVQSVRLASILKNIRDTSGNMWV
jgi:hypothetical protein